ncbi:hypothetical protein MKW92_003970 [Papaver armeniacum]|nr:hypothetical protein MKW92_003970 [Papaver armeniacum]
MHFSVRRSEHKICTYTAQWEYRSCNDPRTKDHPLLIEYPYEQQDNAARAVPMSQLPSISDAFEKNSLVYGLVGGRVSSQLISSHSNPLFFNRGAIDFSPLSYATPSFQNQFYNRPNPQANVGMHQFIFKLTTKMGAEDLQMMGILCYGDSFFSFWSL